jgi:hypothetical protein
MASTNSGTRGTTLLSETVWSTLVERVDLGLCTPFLGPEIALAGTLDPRSIASKWADEQNFPFHDSRNLPRVAEYLAVAKGDNWTPKLRIQQAFHRLGLQDIADGSAYELLARLPIPVYVCTYYDDLMMQALQRNDFRDPQRRILAWNKDLRDAPECEPDFDATVPAPVVFHWYGGLENPRSLVVTERDHLDFLFNFARAGSLVPPRIDEALGGTYLVFLGYRLFELSFQILLRSLQEQIRSSQFRKKHLAVQFVDVEGESERRQAEDYLRKYFEQEEIEVVLGSPVDFVQELYHRWKEFRNAG